ncbi:MAPEG family protein [Colwellia sp. MB02u-18]|uniref:MAPEG family protein n=1 Tax=unclassified Colwellia TaxID=196834 RepID=UPI0015F41936|nr:MULTISPECIES: MAPEG family protein [unclassified Colwellia]MBA6223339.1 MAPEG family protein [Colwellia sp. MB3u-45]MBA6267867.1 MAPEG family protein [Colwellia sp. MB3u-43]MBA6322279.1 MAPEG family protein [Colwellia sp. MB02u-19]MBA6323908.1 MAPEG family protein [Colwellia sp. MB02u-18]MBA6331885.1 MAPEG family protein [Colwellia sp. MB02u-12]
MTTLIICLFIAALLPFIAKIPVAIAMHKMGGYNNNHPRAQQANLTGFGARAFAAHQNAFESLLIFAPAVLLAIATQNTGVVIQQLAITHIVARVLYNIAYLMNIGVIRSLIWGVGIVSSFTIIYQCI